MISCEGIYFMGRVVGMSGAVAASFGFPNPPTHPHLWSLCILACYHSAAGALPSTDQHHPHPNTTTTPYPSLPPTIPLPSHRPTGPGNTQERGTLGGSYVPWIPWNPAEPEKLKGSAVKERTSGLGRRELDWMGEVFSDQRSESNNCNKQLEHSPFCFGFVDLHLSRRFYPKRLTKIHTPTVESTMQGNSQLAQEQSGWGVLLRVRNGLFYIKATNKVLQDPRPA